MSDRTTRRGRDLWLTAGQDLLRTGGVRTIKVRDLADRLGLTTGSFYHHFSSMQDFLDQLAAHFTDGQEAALLASADSDPLARLRASVESSARGRMRELDVAMRDWALTNPAAAAAVLARDALVLEHLERAFVDIGHATDAARLRARLLHAVTVARLSSTWPDEPAVSDRIVDVLAGQG